MMALHGRLLMVINIFLLQPAYSHAQSTSGLDKQCQDRVSRLYPLAVMHPFGFADDRSMQNRNQSDLASLEYFNVYKFSICPLCMNDTLIRRHFPFDVSVINEVLSTSFMCNGTNATVCQLGTFVNKTAATKYETSKPLGTVAQTVIGDKFGWDLNCTVNSDDQWTITQKATNQSISPYTQQNVLLKQVKEILDAISSINAVFLGDKQVDLCDTLGLNSSACDNGELLDRATLPIIEALVTSSAKTITVESKLVYSCAYEIKAAPDISFAVTNKSGTFSLEVGIGHRCCCKNATQYCAEAYPQKRDELKYQQKCEYYHDLQLTVLGYMAAVVTLVIWATEWKSKSPIDRACCESITKHPKYIVKDAFFMFGIISPINFMENRNGSLVVACMFGSLAALIFKEIMNPNGQTFSMATGYLLLLYPLFICRACKNKKLGSAMGAIYCVPFAFFMWLDVGCRIPANQPAHALYALIPAMCCNVFIGWFGFRFYKRLACMMTTGSRPRSSTKRSIWANYDHRAIVAGLFLKTTKERSPSQVLRPTFLHRWWYRNVTDWRKAFQHFRYSPRMLSMVSMSVCMLFNMAVFFCDKFLKYRNWAETEISGGLCCNGNLCHRSEEYLWTKFTANTTTLSLDSLRETIDISYDDCKTNKQITDALYSTLMLSSILMAIVHVISVFNMITVYRKHMMRFYRGDKQFLSKFEPGPYLALTDALKYASYQVIFVISGWLFSTVLVALVFLFIAYTIALPAMGTYRDVFWPWVWKSFIWDSDAGGMGILTLAILLWIVMMGFVWFFFLDRSVYMAIRNRIFWDTFDLFQTVAGFLVGFFMFVKRLLVQFLFGVLFVSRLDKPLVPRGYEAFDPGFACYQGFLMVELYYSNPVMLTFIQLLLDSRDNGPQRQLNDNDDDDVALIQDDLFNNDSSKTTTTTTTILTGAVKNKTQKNQKHIYWQECDKWNATNRCEIHNVTSHFFHENAMLKTTNSLVVPK
eukprot:m.81997 g.81997  ORF g.81997 m.81997 type:complete len:983 (+) comp25477_c2_seq1:183-3131(+)